VSRQAAEAEQFILRWIRNSPGNETRNESIYETASFLFLAQFIFWGVSDYETRNETPMWVSVWTFVSEFRIDFRFLRYETSLVSGFEFRIRVSESLTRQLKNLKKNTAAVSFPVSEKMNCAGNETQMPVGYETQVPPKPTLSHHRSFVSSFVSEFRKMNCSA
jgi:hypothetical protein